MTRDVVVLGVRITDMPLGHLLEAVRVAAASRRRLIVSYFNIHAANLAYEQPWFRKFLNESEIVFCDGFGVRVGAALIGLGLLRRHSVPDFLDALCKLSAASGFRMFFLGAKPGVADAAASTVTARFAGLRIDAQHGYFEKAAGSEESGTVVRRINAFGTDLLLVGFGMPLQEAWIRDNAHELQVPVLIAVGALFDYLGGEVVRPPRWLTDNGLEWLGRLFVEPRRLWRRYLLGIPLFFWRVFSHHILRGPLMGG